jgi:hypothetical protein
MNHSTDHGMGAVTPGIKRGDIINPRIALFIAADIGGVQFDSRGKFILGTHCSWLSLYFLCS